jgi:putative ABC transport system permease protein
LTKDGKYRDLNERPTPVVYSAMSQQYAPAFTLHIRTSPEPKLLIETMRRAFAAVDANMPFFDPRTLAGHIQGATLVQTLGASMLTGFGILALLLATIGLYGVLAFTVSQGTQEFAIRMAVGATPAQVLKMVFKQGLLLTMAGVLIGMGLASGLARLLSSQLLAVTATDPLSYAGAAALCVCVSVIACIVPARRATKVDPLAALRTE